MVENNKTHGLQISTKPEAMWNVHRDLQYATTIFTPPKQSPQRVRQYTAKEELTKSRRSKEKCQLRKLNPKNLQPAVDLEVHSQNTSGCKPKNQN
jgi:hypothetical protein